MALTTTQHPTHHPPPPDQGLKVLLSNSRVRCLHGHIKPQKTKKGQTGSDLKKKKIKQMRVYKMFPRNLNNGTGWGLLFSIILLSEFNR